LDYGLFFEIIFSKTVAPGPATQLKVTEIGSSGFTMYWCNPMPDPQCAGYWDRDVTELEVQIPDLGKFFIIVN